MKTIISFSIIKWKTIALLMLLLVNNVSKAQLDDFICLTNEEPLDSAAKLAFVSSDYGGVFTPKGELRILVIYAGFTNDGDQNSNTSWPYDDGIRPPGESFPTNMNNYFYSDVNQFSPSNTDKSISNYYYQMSLPSGNPLKIVADVFPERINVTADVTTDLSPNPWADYNAEVMNTIAANHPDFDFSPYDNRKNSPSFAFDNTDIVNNPVDNVVDYVIVVWRYNDNPATDPNAPTALLSSNIYSAGAYVGVSNKTFTNSQGVSYTIANGFTFIKGYSGLSQSAFTHELGHNLYNAPHYNGANGIVGDYYYNNTGWGMMNGSVYNCANGWERWYNGWIDITANNNQVNSVINNLSDIQNGGIYTLHDFVTTGDVIRIKLPFVNEQYLWLENHSGATIFDDRYGMINDNLGNPIPTAPRGLIGYIEHLNGVKTQQLDFHQGANGIQYLNANGNFDYSNTYSSPEPIAPEIWNNIVYDFHKGAANPLGKHNALTNLRNDFLCNANQIYTHNYDNSNPNSSLGDCYRNEARSVWKQNGSFTYGALGIGASFGVNSKVDLGSNPMVSNIQKLDFTNDKLGSTYLNGISFEVLSYNADGSVTVKIRLDDYNINNDTRYTGNIILSPNIVATTVPSLILKKDKILDIDKSGTPNKQYITSNNDFINLTTFTAIDQSYFYVESNARVNVINESTLHLKTGSKMELEEGAKLYIGPNSKLIIEDGATLLLKPGATLEIDENATVDYYNTQASKGLLVGSTSYTGYPAKVVVKGKLHLQGSGTKLEHSRDGYYQFYPTHELIAPFWVSIKFVGKGKTRKMIGLEDNTTLSFTGNDIDWYSGLIEYGNNSKIELFGADFKSLLCTYNPNTNPTTGSKGLVIDNPTYLFLNGCDFNQLTEGVNISNTNNVTAQLTSCNFVNNAALGIKVQNSTNLTLTGGLINGGTTGVYAQYTDVLTISTTEVKNTTTGVECYDVPGAYFYGANIHDNATGLKGNVSLLFLRNGARVYNNSLYGVHLTGAYDYTAGNYNTMLTVGDVGCGNIYNNPNVGVWGQDALLNIDAIQHSIDRGDNIVNPNRFDNNGLLTFEFCYGSSAVAPSQINAKGNFWGVTPPDIQPNQYTFIANGCFSKGGALVHIPMDHSNYSTCVPTTSCTQCYGTGGGTTSSSSASTTTSMAVQTSFKEANTQFVEEDNTTTRAEFSDLSAVELIKDSVNDTWQGKSINDELFALDNKSVHLIQVSKAIKSNGNNSNARMAITVDDVFKNVNKSAGKEKATTVTLYPNPVFDKLMVDFEKIEGEHGFKIYNIEGKIMIEQSFKTTHNVVGVNQLPKGIYHYEIISPNKEILTGKISIVK